MAQVSLTLSAIVLGASLSHAASVPAGFTDRQVATGFQSATSMAVLPDGRVLVLEQDGLIHAVKDDALLGAAFYQVQNVDTFAERGCLGITADPNFAVNQYVYVYCTVKNGNTSRNRVLRLTAAGDAALPASEQVILELPDVPAGVQWHMGGPLRFGVDGKLYVGVGGHEDTRIDPPTASFSQNVASPFGKVLRINPDGSFPTDNPFFNTPGAYRGNYLLGFRNPYTMDVQPNTGLLYINDVGAGSFEEINRAIPGANYAWPVSEGKTSDTRFTNAVFEYGRTDGCAITGGSFYNPPGAQFPAPYVGKYLFADYCSGWIRMLDPVNPAAGVQDFVAGIDSPVALATAPDGSLYYLARNQKANAQDAGSLGKIMFTDTPGPRLTLQPKSQVVYIGDPVTFSVAADGASRYQWRRGGVDIPGAASASYTIAQTSLSDNGATFSVVVSNALGSVTSDAASLTVTSNHLPTAAITSPATGTGFTPGTQISFAGTASDAEDGPLPASAFSWKVDFMHDTHVHPFYPATSGMMNGTFTVPGFDAEAANIWLRLSLTVTDSARQTRTVSQDIYPDTQLSDLAPTGTPSNGLGQFERNRNNGGATAGDGGPLRIDGIDYARGLGVFAPSDLRYKLGGACTGHFIADVGLDDTAGDTGSVVFQVYLDDAKVFDSGLMRGKDLRKAIYVSLAGKSSLRLVVSDGGDGNAADFADWGAARVTGCGAGLAVAAAGDAVPGSSPGAALAPPLGGDGGGGGCAIGGDGRFDPILPGLLAMAIGIIGWRRYRRSFTRAWQDKSRR